MEPLKIDVHKYGYKMKQQKDLLKETPMLEENRLVIQEFIDFCKIDPKVHEARIIKYSYLLRKIGQLVDKNMLSEMIKKIVLEEMKNQR